MSPVEQLLAKLADARRSGKGWSARCPAHEDRRASLSVTEGDDGRVLLNCFAGCKPAAIVGALGLTMQHLFPTTDKFPRLVRPEGNGNGNGKVASGTFATGHEAVAALERRHGPASGVWTYRNVKGEPVGMIVRWDSQSGKDIRPVSRRGGRWMIGGMVEPRPLYGLPDLAGTERVYVCEGEKCADAARSIGLPTTTSAHGSKSARKTDWTPLSGKDVVILPDADDAGRKYASDVATILAKLDPPATVRIIQMPGLPEHGDVADFLKQHDAVEPETLGERIERLADAAPIVTAAELTDAAPAAEPERPADATIAPVIVRLADVEPEPVRWLWPNRIALGKLTLLAGDPGLGKSFLSLDIAARVSRGGPWPDDLSARFQPGDVVLLSAEDDIADTIRPRLDAAGADVRRVRAITAIRGKDGAGSYERGVDLGRDLQHLEAAIGETENCRLVIVDPVSAYLGKTDTHKNSAVRGLLAPVAELAARRHVAVVAITHLRKGDGPAIYRSIGSLAFTAAARAVWAVTKDKTEGARRLLLPVKNNLALDVEGMAFQVGSFGVNEQTALAWETAPVAVRAEDALGDKGAATERSDRDDAAAWLREALADGAMEASTVLSEGKQNGLPEKTLRRAFRDIGGKSKKSSFGGAWKWELPAEKPEDAQISRLF